MNNKVCREESQDRALAVVVDSGSLIICDSLSPTSIPNRGNGIADHQILTAKEVALELRCSKAQVYRLLNGDVEGVKPLPCLLLGRKKVVQRSSLEGWKKANEKNRVIVGNESEKTPEAH